jgi:hypothetical protein
VELGAARIADRVRGSSILFSLMHHRSDRSTASAYRLMS